MKLGIDPTVDYAFKRMCGLPETIPILTSLLESILEFKITGLQILNPFINKEFAGDKLSVLDIKAKDLNGKQYNIEIQIAIYEDLIPRFLFYWAKLYASQLVEGEDYWKLCPTISILLVNGVLIKNSNEYYHPVQLQDMRTNQQFSSHLQMHLIEIPKFRKTLLELTSPMDQWVYFLKHAEELDPVSFPSQLNLPEIPLAAEELYKMSQSAIERELYESRLKAQRDELSRQNWSARQREEGREEGREEMAAKFNEKLRLMCEINQRQAVRQEPQSSAMELMNLTPEQLLEKLKQISE